MKVNVQIYIYIHIFKMFTEKLQVVNSQVFLK